MHLLFFGRPAFLGAAYGRQYIIAASSGVDLNVSISKLQVSFVSAGYWLCQHSIVHQTGMEFEKIRPWARGLRLMRLKTIGRGRGGHPWWAHPYSSWLSSIKGSKAIAGQWRVIRSECIRNASVTPRNTEYTKYNSPGAQVSNDALTQKYLLYTPPARLKCKI